MLIGIEDQVNRAARMKKYKKMYIIVIKNQAYKDQITTIVVNAYIQDQHIFLHLLLIEL